MSRSGDDNKIGSSSSTQLSSSSRIITSDICFMFVVSAAVDKSGFDDALAAGQ